MCYSSVLLGEPHWTPGIFFWWSVLACEVCLLSRSIALGIHLHQKNGGWGSFLSINKAVGDGRHMDAVSQLMPRQRKPSLLFHPRVLGALSFSPLKLLPQIRVAWRQFLLAVSIPNENSAPSITSITIISNSPRLSIPRLIADYRLQHYIFSCLLLLISMT